MTESPEQYEFDVAVSFAGEDRDFVREIVEAVRGDLRVFYDEDFVVESWGKDGVEYFTDVYMNRARYAIIFVSQAYLDKMWTRVERRAALARAVTQKAEYVLPIQLESVELPGLVPTVIYLDARRHGLDGITEIIRQKVTGTVTTVSASVTPITKTPRTQEEIQRLIEERPPGWEYLLYGGVLYTGFDALKGKVRDHSIQYARSNGRVLQTQELLDVCQGELSHALQICGNFNAVLRDDAQEAAFGSPGVPGDPDRIVHLATRFVSTYESFLDWSANLRGFNIVGDYGREAFDALARSIEPSISNLQSFVGDFVEQADTIVERLHAGENMSFTMVVTLDLDKAELSECHQKLALALA